MVFNNSVHPETSGNVESILQDDAYEIYLKRKAWNTWAGNGPEESKRRSFQRLNSELPSKKISNSTVRMRQPEDLKALVALTRTEDDADCVDIILREITSDEELMGDSPEAELKRRDTLRSLPQNLTIKRCVRSKLSAIVNLKMNKRIRYSLGFKWKKFCEKFRNIQFSLEFWYEEIRKIEGNYGSTVASYFYFLRRMLVMNLFLSVFVIGFIIIPQIVYDVQNDTAVPSSNKPILVEIVDFISGEGRFKETIMFYGHYYHGRVGGTFNMPHSYFLTLSILYITCFIFVSYKLAQSYRNNFIETSIGYHNSTFSNKVFCGWDFSISSLKTAQLHSNNIYTDFKELLAETFKKKVKQTGAQKVAWLFYFALINTLLLTLMGGIGYGIWILLSIRAVEGNEYWSLTVAVAVTTILTISPFFLSQIVKLERFSPRVSLYLTLLRSYVFVDNFILVLLLTFWYQKKEECWESSLGGEAYCLIVVDLLASIFLLPLIEHFRKFLYRFVKCFGAPEFDIAAATMSLIHTQAIVWLGLWFSPIVSIVAVFKMYISFYVRGATVHSLNKSVRSWRAAHTQTLMLAFVFISLLLTVVFYSFIMFRFSSASCGPFKEYEFIYLVLTQDILKVNDVAIFSFLHWMFRPAFRALIFIAICAVIYVLRARGKAQKTMAAILKHMLTLEAQDKKILLETITKVTNGEWVYNPKSPDALEHNDSYTYKYLHGENVRKPANAGYKLLQNTKKNTKSSMFIPNTIIDDAKELRETNAKELNLVSLDRQFPGKSND